MADFILTSLLIVVLIVASSGLQKGNQYKHLKVLVKNNLDAFSEEHFLARGINFLKWLQATEAKVSASKDYYKSYSHYSAHLAMLNDQPRTDAYYTACLDNNKLFKDKIVLDVGCGTGILSFFAAWAGAKHVYCVENAEIAVLTKEIVSKNNMNEKITVIKGVVENVVLPVEKVDTIISEWMGTFLLYEGMLETVLYARDKYLAEGGIMVPDRAVIKIAGFRGNMERAMFIDFWDSVYDIDMSATKDSALSSPKLGLIPEEQILTEPVTILDLDLYTTNKSELAFMKPFTLETISPGIFDGIAGWFDVHFFSNSSKHSELTTGPEGPATHWRQVVFFLDKPIEVKPGELIKGIIAVKNTGFNRRFLDVRIRVEYNHSLISDRTYHIE